MFTFSVKLLITNIIGIINGNLLTVLFGRLFPISSVGNYTQANKWSGMSSSVISGAIGQISQTVFVSVSEEREREIRVFRKMIRFAAFLSFPLILGLALVSQEFIVVALGEKWAASGLLLQILCIGGAFIPLQTLYQNLIISRGRSDSYLRLVALQIVLQIILTLSLAPLGITAMVAGFSALNVCFTACWHFALQHIHPLSMFDVLKDTMPFALIAAVVMLATHYITLSVTTLWLLLLTRMMLAAVLYLVIMRLLNVAILKECLQFIRKKNN